MLLAIDIGNSNIVAGIFQREELVTSFRISTDRKKTYDDYAVILTSLIENNEIRLEELSGAILACVVPGLLEVMVQTVSVYLDIEPLIVDCHIKTGLEFRCDNPEEIGADRIANAVAALNRYDNSSVIVDFGTATTFDCVSGNSEFLGGVIAPGFLTSSESLYTSAARLPRTEYIRPDRVIGRNTVESLRSGFVLGYVSMVDGMIERIVTEMAAEINIIATGGLSYIISRESRYIEETDDFLTLRGLKEIFELNV